MSSYLNFLSLHQSIRSKILNLLLKCKADVDLKEGQALQKACGLGHEEATKALLAAGPS